MTFKEAVCKHNLKNKYIFGSHAALSIPNPAQLCHYLPFNWNLYTHLDFQCYPQHLRLFNLLSVNTCLILSLAMYPQIRLM